MFNDFRLAALDDERRLGRTAPLLGAILIVLKSESELHVQITYLNRFTAYASSLLNNSIISYALTPTFLLLTKNVQMESPFVNTDGVMCPAIRVGSWHSFPFSFDMKTYQGRATLSMSRAKPYCQWAIHPWIALK
jgi:hypothetical protein